MRKIGLYILLIICCAQLNASSLKHECRILFEQNSYKIDQEFCNNKNVLDSLFLSIRQIEACDSLILKSIEIKSYASPEGGTKINERISFQRKKSFDDYIYSNMLLHDSVIYSKSCGVAWDELSEMIEESSMPDKDDIINIIKYVPEETYLNGKVVDDRLGRLKEYKDGIPYKEMYSIFFPLLRKVMVEVEYEKVFSSMIENEFDNHNVASTNTEEPIQQMENLQTSQQDIEMFVRKPFFAIKTNLLYDAITAINVSLEMPVSERLSVQTEIICPWWKSDSKQYCLQILSANAELKYWFEDRSLKDVLTGWYAGWYVGAGLFDLEFGDKGFNGECLLSTGVEAGYSHSISKRLHMEYSLGVGFMQIRFKEYYPIYGLDKEWHLIRKNTQPRYFWVGPTSAKMSLVWMIGKNVKDRYRK